VALRASISVEVLQASVSSAKASASVTYELSHATGIWTDADSKNRFWYEEFAVNDVQINWVQKVFKDSSNFTDDETLHVNKRLIDSPNFTDEQLMDFSKYIAEIADITDAHATLFTKALTDSPSRVTDLQNAHVGKSVGEHIADIVDTEIKAFNKAKQDNANVSDGINKLDFFKGSQDAANFSDDETVAFAKFITEYVGVTDDIDGTASILDDQEMVFFKHTTDLAAATDLFTRVVAYVRSYTDNAATSDIAVTALTKPITEAPKFTDIHRADISKLLNDLPRITDALAIELVKAPFVDAATISDVSTLNPGKIFTRMAQVTDTGSLRSQGYCDFTFFEEDYVGASRTF